MASYVARDILQLLDEEGRPEIFQGLLLVLLRRAQQQYAIDLSQDMTTPFPRRCIRDPQGSALDLSNIFVFSSGSKFLDRRSPRA